MPLDAERVYEAILEHGGVAQAAERLGVSRELLYKSYADAVRRGQAELRRRKASGPLLVPIRVPLPAELVAALDAAARREGTNRTAVAAALLASLPEPLPAPIGADGGRLIPLAAPAPVLEDLKRQAGAETNGVIRAILKKGMLR